MIDKIIRHQLIDESDISTLKTSVKKRWLSSAPPAITDSFVV
ncbi:hypothetical protein [Pseudarthrobacter albicanus]|nr:hypothetical protein [Pseudarthrobacter albicanus]